MKIINYIILALLVFSCKPREPEPRYPVSQKSGSYIKESIAVNKKLVAEEEEIIQEIIEQDTVNDYQASPNGFWYYYVEKDTAEAPTPNFGDVVTFNYNIKNLEDQIIYSEEELSPKAYAMDKEKLFTGLREGLKLMKEGETVTFLFPSHKAYGYYGDRDRIGTNVPLKSTVTLLDIKPVTNIDSINSKP